MSRERENRYAEAMAKDWNATAEAILAPGDDDVRARALISAAHVMAVADEEQAKLRSHLIDRIAEFDPSDEYHGGHDYDDRSYYAAIDRCVRLINGSLTDWRAR